MLRILSILALCLLALSPARAVQPDEILGDPVLESRARTLSGELRCLVCQNESIDESNAALAKDLRLIVRERLLAGDTDQQVLDFMVQRYGEFVLLRPRFSWQNALLWAAPLLAVALGVLVLGVGLSRRRTTTTGLTAEEEARLAKLMADAPKDGGADAAKPAG